MAFELVDKSCDAMRCDVNGRGGIANDEWLRTRINLTMSRVVLCFQSGTSSSQWLQSTPPFFLVEHRSQISFWVKATMRGLPVFISSLAFSIVREKKLYASTSVLIMISTVRKTSRMGSTTL